MLKETHYPSKWSVVLVFLVIILLIGGVFAWAFYFNLGTVTVTSVQEFQMSVNGDGVPCEKKSCEISVPPGEYSFKVNAEGYYPQDFRFQVERFQDLDKEISFILIPFLQDYDDKKLPERETSKYVVQASGSDKAIIDSASKESIASFETLIDPVLSYGGNQLTVVDEGRLFFVDLDTGRKLRRFDDDIYVNRAETNSDGTRTLLFVEMDDRDILWMWFHDNNELFPLTWETADDLFQWQYNSVNLAYVISDQLVNTGDESFIDDLLSVTEIDRQPFGLYAYNFDTDEAQLIQVYEDEKNPKEFLIIAERYFILYEDESVEELIVSDLVEQ
jgi:hypothetical protein